MLVFSNPGEIDPRLITTLGMNVKNSDNPIGKFGTGLKYSIAILLRKGCQISISAGFRRFTFSTETEHVRGKDFDVIFMTEDSPGGSSTSRLGFTTELGAHWQLWMAYRELASNCMDEGGAIVQLRDNASVDREAGVTKICVFGLDSWYEKQASIFLESAPLWENDEIAIHPGESESIFYQRIRVKKLDKPSLFTYDIKRAVTLTEDRTLEGTWYLNYYLAGALLSISDETIRETVLRASSDRFESTLDFTSASKSANKGFFETVAKIQSDGLPVSSTASRLFSAEAHLHYDPKEIKLDPDDQEIFDWADQHIAKTGFADGPVKFYDTLGPGYFFKIFERPERHIALAKSTFTHGDEALAEILLFAYIVFSHPGFYPDDFEEVAKVLAKHILGHEE